jgi:hypothetical protein
VIGGFQDLTPRVAHYSAVLWCTDSGQPQVPTPKASAPVQQLLIDQLGPQEFATTLERFVRLNPRALPSLLIADAMSTPHLENYQQLISEVHATLEDAQRMRLTRQKDGFTWQKNILLNAENYLGRRLPPSWAGGLRGQPAFICGSGPSLDVSIAPLVTHASNAVIFAADSALLALANHGVRADFAVSVDAAKLPAKCLPPNHLPRRVALASVSPANWPQAIPADSVFFVSGNQLTDDWFATLGATRTAIGVTESCGSTAIELAFYLGCDPIFLFGLDLAVDPANQARRHQSGASPDLYAKSNYDSSVQLPRVPGNYAETVPCFALGDWRALDARLGARTETRVFNVNDRGARLRGTTLLHPAQFAPPSAMTSKAQALARLSPIGNELASMTALTRLRTVGVRSRQAVPSLQRALLAQGPSGLAAAFRLVVLDPEIGRALGAFALKLMPHLVEPIEGDTAFWSTLLDEFAELSAVASAV